MKKVILVTILLILFIYKKSYCQQDTTQVIKVKYFRLSYEYLEKFVNEFGAKDSMMNFAKLTECQSAKVFRDSLLLVNHDKGKEIIPFRNITGIKFQSSTNTIPGIVIGAMAGLTLAALTGIVYTITQTQHDTKAGHVGFVIFAISAPFCALGGAIPGGIIGSKIHQFKSYDLEIYPPEKRKEVTLRLLKDRSRFKEF